jgi:hypothetical protein
MKNSLLTAQVSSYIQILVSGDYKKMKTCRMAVSKSLQFFDHVVYGLPKDGPYNQIINDQYVPFAVLFTVTTKTLNKTFKDY